MNKVDTIHLLKKQAKNKSPKPLARLKAALADIERNSLISQLPGSTRRGLNRGNLK